MAAGPKPNEFQIIRLYEAPVKAVWEAWTDPAQVAKWWGPRGFTLTSHSKELRPGGVWHYTMHGPDGTDYENKTLYHEVKEREKLVYDHGGNDERAPLFRVTALFSPHGKGGTKLELTMSLPSPEAAAEMRKFIRKAGGDSTWDRLAEYLAKEELGKERFVINRSFEAIRERLFELWAKPEHLSRWLAPTGFSMTVLRADARPGGECLYAMSNGAGVSFHGRIAYRELRPPELLVYTNEFCDEQGRPARHPGMPLWPASMLTLVQLSEEGPERTRVTVTWEPEGEVTPAELEAFLRERGGMALGWTGSFDKLEELLLRL